MVKLNLSRITSRIRFPQLGFGEHRICIATVLWRFATGNHMDGRARCNTSWLLPGTLPRHKANWWNRKPRLYRAGWRWGVVIVLTAEIYLAATALLTFYVITLAMVPFGTARLYRGIRSHMKWKVSVRDTPIPGEVTPEVERFAIDNMGAIEMDTPQMVKEGKIVRDKRFDVRRAMLRDAEKAE